MASNEEEVKRAAMAELARRELARRQQQQSQRVTGERGTAAVKRELGLGARNILEGGMDVVAPFADLVGYGINKALPGDPLPYNHSQNFSQLLTRAGLPEPQGRLERGVNIGSRIAVGAMAGRGVDKAITGAMGQVPGASQQVARAAPTTERLKDLSREAYQQAENAGVVISPQSFKNSIDDIVSTAAKEGIDPTLHPQATAALKRLTDVVQSGEPIALQQLETLRKIAKGAAGSISSDERRIARIIVDSLDDYALNLGQADIVAGDASANVGQLLSRARNLWSRASKSEAVEELITRAQNRSSQFSGSGYENALRTEFRNLIQNPRRLRLFSPAEQNALRTVARGGPIENTLRYFGKLAPTGAVSGAIGAGAGAAIGGVPGAVAVPMLGAGARQGATALTARNARLAAELMRRGGPAAAGPGMAPIIPYALGGTPSLYEFLMRKEQQ